MTKGDGVRLLLRRVSGRGQDGCGGAAADRGASAVEQALLTTGIAGAVLVSAVALGQALRTDLECVAHSLLTRGSVTCDGSSVSSLPPGSSDNPSSSSSTGTSSATSSTSSDAANPAGAGGGAGGGTGATDTPGNATTTTSTTSRTTTPTTPTSATTTEPTPTTPAPTG